MPDDAVATGAPVAQLERIPLADDAEAVRVVDVQERVVVTGDACERAHIGRVPGHRVHAVHRDDARA